jgi:hypothetical protein
MISRVNGGVGGEEMASAVEPGYGLAVVLLGAGRTAAGDNPVGLVRLNAP